MRKSVNKAAFIFVGIAVSIIFLWLAMRNIHLVDLWAALSRTDMPIVGLVCLIYGLFFLTKGIRWKYILSPIQDIAIRDLFPPLMIGIMVSDTLNVYLGEVVRTYYLSKQVHLRKSSILASIFLERTIDVLTILFLLATTLLFSQNAPDEIKTAGIVFGLMGCLSLLLIYLFVHWKSASEALFRRVIQWLPQNKQAYCLEQLQLVRAGFGSMQKPNLILTCGIISVVQWIFMGLANYFSILAVGVEVPISAAFLTMGFIAFGMVLPSSPGHIGIIQFCYVLALGSYGVSASDAFSAAIIFHITLYAVDLFLGLSSLRWIRKRNLEDLS